MTSITKKQKIMLARLAVSGGFLLLAVLAEKEWEYSWALFLVSYLCAGYDIILRAVRNIAHGQALDENFLMTIATFGAVYVNRLEEAAAVMLFYQVGEWFSDYAVNKSRNSISALMDINPEYANLLRDGLEEKVDPYEVEVGDLIVVKPGERVPLDGIVTKGTSSLDMKALTGESMPVEAVEGREIISGSINLNGLLEVKVTKAFDDSTVAKILELVENASSRKAKAENFITKFARVYTPVVVLLAVLLAVVPPLLLGWSWDVWVYRACEFLVVSCPCALVISVPLSFFGGLGAASKQGVLVKGSNYLEAVASLDTVVFDKTGTLTTGEFQVTGVEAFRGTEEELLETAVYGEFRSNHPIALSVKAAYKKSIDESKILSVEEIAGCGVHARIAGADHTRDLYLGNDKLMRQRGIQVEGEKAADQSVLYVAEGDVYLGAVYLSDTIRPDVPEALRKLKTLGVRRLVMLTGDREETGKAVADRLGLDESYGGLLPGDKVSKVEELLTRKPADKTLGFVGDGINDAPVLALADIGIAMGGIGSDAAVEAADMVIMTDEPSKLADAVGIARKTMDIVRQNIVFAIGVKVLFLMMIPLGIVPMRAAVFADVGVSIIVILNSTRALRYVNRREKGDFILERNN